MILLKKMIIFDGKGLRIIDWALRRHNNKSEKKNLKLQ